MNYGNAIQSLKWLIKADSLEERERLLIQWYEKHVKEFQVSNFSDAASEKNKEFAKYTEESMLHKAVAGVVKNAEITREAMGNQYVRKLKVMVLVDA